MNLYPWNGKGFTLAELLIALGILGVIATFTIPKLLSTQSDGKYKATAKEAVSTISGAFQLYVQEHGAVTSSMTASDLMPYMNYVRRDSTSLIDDVPGAGTTNCASDVCLVLHNGGILAAATDTFGGTASTNAIFFGFDPDGKQSAYKGINFFIYPNGRITSEGGIEANTRTGSSTHNPNPALDPSWFSW